MTPEDIAREAAEAYWPSSRSWPTGELEPTILAAIKKAAPGIRAEVLRKAADWHQSQYVRFHALERRYKGAERDRRRHMAMAHSTSEFEFRRRAFNADMERMGSHKVATEAEKAERTPP